jgi:DNA topoisomerase-3
MGGLGSESDHAPPPARPPVRARPRAAVPEDESLAQAPDCNCSVPAGARTVTKESANQGRKFWTCGKGGECDFFQWADDSGSSGKVIPAKRNSDGISVRDRSTSVP